jgi:hypothetical protein
MLHTFTANAVNTNAKAKIIVNKKLDTVRVVVAFNVTEITKNGAYKFPAQNKCAFVSSDIDKTEVLQQLAKASKILNTNNITLVE